VKPEVEAYRSLHISDVHMSNSLPHARQTNKRGVTDRLADQLALWARVYEAAKRARCECIFIQGDLFDHSRSDAITLTETFSALARAPVPVFIVAGNHDGVNTRGERFTVEALSYLKTCRYMETGETFSPRPWLSFWPLEFAPIERTREALKAMALKRDVTNVLLMHNSIVGCTHSGWTCEEGQGLEAAELTDHFDHVLSGHFHDPQKFGRNGRYLGAPMHHRFDDVGRPAGFWVMEWRPTGERKEIFVDGGAPRFHALSFSDKEARANLKARSGDYVRVIVRCTHAKLVKRQLAADRFVEELTAKGLRASWVHDPVYHHVSRLTAKAGKVEVLTPRKMVPSYVEAVEVDTSGLDQKALKRLGREIFVAVEGEWRG
jgi:DNA repair exonuclease SbcCD nuclease subunit